MKWIGQHIWDFVSRFRNDVYLENIVDGTVDSDKFLGLDTNGKVVKEAVSSGTTYTAGDGLDLDDTEFSVDVSDFMTNGVDNRIVTATGADGLNAESQLTYDGSTNILTVSSLTNNRPAIYITSQNADSGGPAFNFVNNLTGEDDDDLGVFKWSGDNAADVDTLFAQILAEIETAAEAYEAGKLSLTVACSNETTSALQQALTATGHGTDNIVSIGLGYGDTSITTIEGTLTMGTTAAMTNAGLLSVANQSNITGLGTISSGTWEGTTIATGQGGTGSTSTTYCALGSNVSGTLPVGNGGTGATSLTDGGVLLGSGSGAITAMSVLGDGEMIVGDGTTDPVAESGATLRTSIGCDAAGTDNSTDVTVAGSLDYITLSGQELTRNAIDLATDVTGVLPHANIGDDAIDGDNIADDVINSEHYVAASIDNEHLADNAVDTDEIADDAVTYAKIQDVSATDKILGRDSAGAGVIEEITPANLRTMINVADGANAYAHPDHTGEVTSTADGATVIADDIVDEANLKISNAGSNGNFLSKQSEDTGGLTWAAIPTLNQNTTGNAATATALETTRGLQVDLSETDSSNFDGSGDVLDIGVTGVLASANLDADTAHLNEEQTFTGSKTMSTNVKFNFRDGNSYINSPASNDLEIVATDIVLDAATSIALENDTTIDGDLTVDKITTYQDYADTVFETQLAQNEGSGEVLKYGGTQAGGIGTLHFLQTDGDWDLTDANDVDKGGSQLLGIALDASDPAKGMLLNGYIRISSSIVDGTPVIGAPVFVADVATGEFDFDAPVGNADYVRIVGYCIDTHGGDILLRFKPDNTFVEVSA